MILWTTAAVCFCALTGLLGAALGYASGQRDLTEALLADDEAPWWDGEDFRGTPPQESSWAAWEAQFLGPYDQDTELPW